MNANELIARGETALGIELGSTRIKGVLCDFSGNVLATGFFEWENKLQNGVWTYSLEDAEKGLRACYASLRENVKEKYGAAPRTFGAVGVSAMMHGYIALDEKGRQLAPFQTWRNTNTQKAADELTGLFDFNIPLRWSCAHLYQRALDNEEHVSRVSSVFTLAAYIHYRLTGEKVTGVGDASGMFPIDAQTLDYDENMVKKFDARLKERGVARGLRELFPRPLTAGQNAGYLTPSGAALLDGSGELLPGVPFCPPVGDAGTGMTATNAVAPRTGNLSAGTSVFAMIVLEKPLSRLHREIDIVTTPTGAPCAMSHANNGSTDINAWAGVIREACALFGVPTEPDELYSKLYNESLQGDPDCGGLMTYGWYSGENVTFINEGRPLILRRPESRLTLANLMRAHLYSSLGAVKLGLDILFEKEGVKLSRMTGHGGLFKTPGVMTRYLAAAVNAPVTVLKTANEGGAWGIALLAAYTAYGKRFGALEDYLDKAVFSNLSGETVSPDPRDAQGFSAFMERYKACLDVEKAAIENI
ncbi:MAG: ATPase [Clostridia bacterium]|nr:ATPase [Clostridia bacterium]